MSFSPLQNRRAPSAGSRLLHFFALLCLSACAGDYVGKTASIRQAYESGEYNRALLGLEALEKDGSQKDRLLILLDRGMLLHAEGRYAESIPVLAEADRIAAELDVTSISEEAGVLLSNERERAYRGEDFERLMISVLQALNYAQLGNDEDALVEVRRVNERLEKMVAEEKKPYQQLAIARYLGGVLYEDQGEWDSAYIDYAKALELEPGLGPLSEPLLRLAKKTGREDAYAQLQKQFPKTPHSPLKPDEGQIVVIVEAGRSPEKVSRNRTARADTNEVFAVPVFEDRGGAGETIIRLGDQQEKGVTVTSIREVAKLHLNDRVGRMLLQQVAAMAVKAGIAGGVGALTKSEDLGILVFLLLNVTNAPDLRSWLSLPAEFQVARFRVPAGTHTVSVSSNGRSTQKTIEVQPKRVRLLVVRHY